MEYDDLTEEQKAQVHARFHFGNLRGYLYEITREGSVLSRRKK